MRDIRSVSVIHSLAASTAGLFLFASPALAQPVGQVPIEGPRGPGGLGPAPALLPAPPGPIASAVIEAELDADRGDIRGTVRVSVRNPASAPLTRAYLWLLPNRLSAPPAALNDVNYHWVYPSKFNPGSMSLKSVSAGPPGREQAVPDSARRAEPHAVAGRGVLWSVTLPEPIAPGQRLSLLVEYRAHIPERYGPLGCIDGQCTLAGGFYPMLAAVDGAGWDLTGPPMTCDMEVSVTLERPASMVIFDQAFGQAPARMAPDVDQALQYPRVATARARRAGAAYAPVFVAPRLYETERQRPGLSVRYLSRERAPPTDVAHEQILPYVSENHARYALDGVDVGLDLLAEIKAPTPTGRLVLVEAPLRFELADTHPGAIAVTDRFFRIWPAKRFRKFHERQLVRAVFTQVMSQIIGARGREHPRNLSTAADLVASYLTDLYIVKQYRKNESIGDILKPVAFIPVVDQLLYAPQTMFAGAFSGSVLDDEPVRDQPERFMHQRPRGRLLYEKLRDLLEVTAMRAAMRAIIVDGVRYRQAAEGAFGNSLDWFFRQWQKPYPLMDYRLADIASKKLPRGAGFEHTVRVERRTMDGARPLVEPVTVLIVLQGGKRERVRWDGRGSYGVVSVRADQPIERVVLDPDRRLVERKLPGDAQHPLFNNRTRHRVRFVYNSFGVLLNITDLSALLAADFSLGRVRDVIHGSRFSLYTSASTLVGMSARYRRRFGPEITPDRLLSSATFRLSAQRLRAGFFGEQGRAASRVSIGASIGSSDLLFLWEPRHARDWYVSGSASVTRRDAVADPDNSLDPEYLVSGSLSFAYSNVFTVADSHTLAFNVGGALVLGELQSRTQLISGGGAGGIRGYAPGQIFGRGLALGRAEYRHIFTHRMNWNVGHYNFVRGLGGAVFADVGILTPCESYDPTGDATFYAAAGYGVRLFYDSFGTLPQLMRVDFAIPLVRNNRNCLGDPPVANLPVMVYLGFAPPF